MMPQGTSEIRKKESVHGTLKSGGMSTQSAETKGTNFIDRNMLCNIYTGELILNLGTAIMLMARTITTRTRKTCLWSRRRV